MKWWKPFAGLLVVLALAGQNAGWAQTKSQPQKAAPSKVAAASYDKALLTPAKLVEKAPETFAVKFTTTKGNIVIRVTRVWSPRGADRFYNLVEHHFYDGAAFFRVLPRFVVQFGLSAYPEVSAAWSRAPIRDDPAKASNKRSMVTYAMAGPNTRTTQVFINLSDNTRLDSMGFAPFGEVIEGMDVVEMLYSGYGEGAPEGRGPRQDLIESRGRAYLERDFPKLDSIKTAVLVSGASAPAAKKPAKP